MMFQPDPGKFTFLKNLNEMLLKSLLLTSVILLSYKVFFGQSGFPYDKEWKLIDSLIYKKNLPKSALIEVNKVYVAAKKENNDAQWVKAIIYKNYLKKTDDRNINQAVAEMEQEINGAPPLVSALLKSVEAEGLFQYTQENLYQFRNRTTIVADTSTDISTWTMNRLNQRIRFLYLASLENPEQLKKTPIGMYDAVLLKGNARELRPTLFDLLAWRALDYFRADEPGSPITSDDRLMENPNLFSEALFFQHFGFISEDSVSNLLTAIRIYQQLLRFHTKDVRLDAWINADISRIQFVYQYAQMPDKDSLYLSALGRITSQFGTLSISSQAWYLQAVWWAGQADTYDPLKDTAHRYDNLKAIPLCEQAVKHPDSSEGRWNCEELLRKIRRPSFNIHMESVNLPNLPFRALVTYTNIQQLYGRFIRIDEVTRESFEENGYDDKFWTKLLQRPFEKSFHQVIPETGDFQEHRVEIKIDALPIGLYALLTSPDPDFSNHKDLGLSTFFCSSIAYVKNGSDYFVVDRNTGHPLQAAKIATFVQKYVSGNYVYAPGKTYQADAKGYVHLLSGHEGSYQKLEFHFGDDFLSSSDYSGYNNGNYNGEETKNKLTDYLFTDRSIYRPGQTVYFKGLLISRDQTTKKFAVVPQRKTKIILKDVNDQVVDSLVLQSNEFGSVHGTFHLPENLLGGEFSIYDEGTKDEQSISVEEYKRPSFDVEYDSVKSAYRLRDTIRLGGMAQAYSGNAIDDAKFNYRVYRETIYPYPWMFRSSPHSAEVEVAHGEGFTNALGKFNIHFPALPDKSVNKLTQPVYYYRVETTITDPNGESRSGTATVSASYQSFEIVSSLQDQEQIDRDSLYRIPATTKNSAGLYVKENLTMIIYALKAPKRLIRKRYWEQPDLFVMTEKEFTGLFPNDEYRDESEVKTWDKGEPVYQNTFSTNADGFLSLDKKWINSLTPGWYEFEFRATDVDGTEIMNKRFVQVGADNKKPGYLSYNHVPIETVMGEPGLSVNIQTGSDAKDLYVIRLRQGIYDSANKYFYYRLNEQFDHSMIDIHEADRGGFAITDVFVVNNRWYISRHVVRVPWTNKELMISYLTWKDKSLPGSPEQWKIKISGAKKDNVAAEIMTSMYDASLDQLKSHYWNRPSIYPIFNLSNPWNADNVFGNTQSIIKPPLDNRTEKRVTVQYDALISPEDRNRGMYKDMVLNAPMALQGRVSGLTIVKDGDVMDAAPPKAEMAKFTAPKKVQDVEAIEMEPGPGNQNQPADHVQIRKNFNETAFFQPALKTDPQGNVEITFTMPDALTRWKWMILAHTKELAFGYSEKEIITQKELMIQTNMPRFFREGDSMMLPVKIANLSAQNMQGTVQLEWLDAETNKPVDQLVGNLKGSKSFTVNASQSTVVFFPANIPAHFTQPISYRVIAKTDMKGTGYSDGEEAVLPVLSNRMLVTESLPINMTGKTEQLFAFEKLLKSGASNSLQNQALTVEYTTNPAWYAVQSLPYLMEFPYECAEQTFNRFYANALATHIVKLTPAIEAVLAKWKNTDTAALMSNLQKNEELKSALLRETPWVLDAQTETQQKKNLALLFDLLKMRSALKGALDKLQLMQSEAGGFPWFKGGRDDRYITQYIISGIGRLKKLNALPADLQAAINKMLKSGIGYLDREINNDYTRRDKRLAAQNLGPLQIQYLYMRSLFPDITIPPNGINAANYFRKQSIDNWIRQSVYMQAMIALYLSRTGAGKTAKEILASLKENATVSAETGMYWKSVSYGYYWQEAPVETQSLIIETFHELQGDQKDIDQMKYWLLQQKHTTHWPTTKATADACYALLLTGSDWLSANQTVIIRLGNYEIKSNEEKTEAGTGYLKKQIPGDQIKPDMGNIQVNISEGSPSTVNRQPSTIIGQRSTVNGQPSWGAVYWQYFENLDKITSAQTQLSIIKNLFIEKNAGKGPVLEAVTEQNKLKPGDKLIMRITLKMDRDLEYVHLKDKRAACLEPVNVLSGYQWQGGLGYYETTRDASTSFFFDRLPKGVYVFEYPVFVTTGGNYSNGISSLECMYAPEFAAHSDGARLQVESK
jgi:Bacterial Alpha-2-macroglobulin MG10 domain/Alpha-2-macroglobulin family/MG2 domain